MKGKSFIFVVFLQCIYKRRIRPIVNLCVIDFINRFEIVIPFKFTNLYRFIFLIINPELKVTILYIILHLTRYNRISSFFEFIPKINFPPSFKSKRLKCQSILIKFIKRLILDIKR